MFQDSVPDGSYNDPFLSSVSKLCVSKYKLCVCVGNKVVRVCVYKLCVCDKVVCK